MNWVSFVLDCHVVNEMLEPRLIRADDLAALLELYQHLHTADAPLPAAGRLQLVWGEIIADRKLRCFVVERDGKLISSCMLVIVPNLTRGARPYGLIENVVTYPDFRGQGIGTALLRHALQIARQANCYEVMLLTGSKSPETLRFYERAGFRRDVKTGFVATPDD
jgi:GNAT superfamily N-acetyltransferase